ncbi:MAG: hypothetical protein V3575_04780 [Candidatus Absconditabacteria bacterium]
MKKGLLILLMLQLFGIAYGQVDHFNVTISPNPLKVNEAADLKVIALDSDGNVVKDYIGDIYIQEDEALELGKDVELPNDQMYTFSPEDQGQKIFSKGTIFKKAGDFEIIVSDIATEGDDEIIGKASVTVTQGETITKGDINIASPVDGGVEVSEEVDVIGSSSLPNSQFVVEVNGKKTEEGITDDNGDFVSTISGLQPGDHTIKVIILNLDNEPLAESNLTNFEVQTASTEWFKSLSVYPGNQVAEMQNFIITVLTDESVNSVEVEVGSKFVMDKEKDGVFTKSMSISEVGIYPISLDITNDGVSKKYENRGEMEVLKGTSNSIGEVTVKQEPGITNEVKLDWQFSGTIDQYLIKYGTSKDKFELEVTSSINSVAIKNLDPSKVYYAQIFPIAMNGTQDGIPSNLVTIEIVHGSACVIQGIELDTKQINGKNYLVWDKVDGASKYIIYKSDSDPDGNKNNMVKVGETTELMFEYPFDINSKKDIYSYYSVYANCSNGELQIDAVKKVKVGPMDTLLLMLLISFFFYGMFRLYGFSKEY